MNTRPRSTLPAILVSHHEICSCGHCRCQHHGGFSFCAWCAPCDRYTWPGENRDFRCQNA